MAAVDDRTDMHRRPASPRRAVRLQEGHRRRSAPLDFCKTHAQVRHGHNTVWSNWCFGEVDTV